MKAVHTIEPCGQHILLWIVMIILSVMSIIVFAGGFRIVHLSISMERGAFKNIF